MIASICDRCGAVVDASGDDAPLAFYAQVMGEDAVAMDDLCPECLGELRSMLSAFARNEVCEVRSENVTVPYECPGADEQQQVDGMVDVAVETEEHATVDEPTNEPAAPVPQEPPRNSPRRIGAHSFSIPRTGRYTPSDVQD